MPEDNLPDLEGRDVLVLREGTHNGHPVPFKCTPEVFDEVVKRTIERGQDIVFAKDLEAGEGPHSLAKRGHGILRVKELYVTMGKWGRELRGLLRSPSEWLRKMAKEVAWPFVSPDIDGFDGPDDIAKNPHKGFITGLSPTTDPAMSPQTSWLEKSAEGVTARLNIAVEPKSNPNMETVTMKLSGGEVEVSWPITYPTITGGICTTPITHIYPLAELAAKSKKRAAERVVKALKGKKGIDNPWALKNWLKKHKPEMFKKIARKALKKKRGG